MSRFHFTLGLALLALASPGCTLLTNGNQYVGTGTDAGPANDGASPDTTIDAATDAASDSGPHMNQPPVLGSLGLDNYRPMVGETTRAIAGHVVDPDGDATSVHYQWFVNGAMRASATTAALDTHALVAGDLIHVEGWANDGTVDGPHVSTSDVPVLDDVTRWRQLLPTEGGRLPQMVWDAPNHRAVRFADGAVWEYTLEGSALRATYLPTTGTPPPADDEDTLVLFDEMRRRMIIFAGSDPTNIYSLDITHRGGSAWMQTPTTGTPPAYVLLSTTFYDPASRRAFVVGSKDDTLGAIGTMYSLDLSSAGGESWSTVTPTGDTMPPTFASVASADPMVAGRFHLIGGVTSTLGSPTVEAVYTMVDHVAQLDINPSGGVAITIRSATCPPAFGAVAAPNRATGHVIVYGGITMFGPGAAPAPPQIYDPTTQVFTTIPGTLPHGAVLGTLYEDPLALGHFTALTTGASVITGTGAALQYDDVMESGVTQIADRESPTAISDAAARFDGSKVEIVGGVDQGGTAVTSSWALDSTSLQWSALVTHDDAATSHHPDLRYGVVSDPSPVGGHGNLYQVGGARAAAVLADMTVFELDSNDHWLERTLLSGSAPPGRVGAIATPAFCGSGRVIVYGGEDAGGTPLSDAWLLGCTADHACTWAASDLGSARSYPAVLNAVSNAYVFGGRTAGGAVNDIVAITPCSGTTAMTFTFTTTGAPPTARYASTFTALADAAGLTTLGVSFGGTDGTMSFGDVNVLTIAFDGLSGTWAGLVPAGSEAPRPRAHHVAVPDHAQNRVIVIGGRVEATSYSYEASDVWELVLRP